MTRDEAKVGTRVRTLVEFSDVPKGTAGVIDEDYGRGVMVAWELASRPLPRGYRAHDGRPAVATGILRDGFAKDNASCTSSSGRTDSRARPRTAA